MLQSVIVIMSNIVVASMCVFVVSTFVIAALLKKRGLVNHRLAAVNIAPYLEHAARLVKSGDRDVIVTYRIWKASLTVTIPLFFVLMALLILRDTVLK